METNFVRLYDAGLHVHQHDKDTKGKNNTMAGAKIGMDTHVEQYATSRSTEVVFIKKLLRSKGIQF